MKGRKLIWLTPVLIVVVGVIGALAAAPWWVLSLIGAVLAVLLILGDIVIENQAEEAEAVGQPNDHGAGITGD
jgi:hypothetical protein